jgi:hypothetical protein
MPRERPSKQGYPSAVALAVARALQKTGREYNDEQMLTRGQNLEERALDAIKRGKSELPPLN